MCNYDGRCAVAGADWFSTPLWWWQLGREAGWGWCWWRGVQIIPLMRWSCLKPPRLDKPHQMCISPLFSHPLLSPPQRSSRSHPVTSPPYVPHHCIIVSCQATRLVDTQSGEEGAMMNCSLLVLSMMIIINFPTTLPREWGPESCSVTVPPPWAVTKPTVITYQRQKRGPRLNADENETHSF